MFKLPHNALIWYTSKEILKILQSRHQQYVNQELADVHAEFRKGRGTRDQIANIHWIRTNCGKLLNRWEYQIILPASW